MGEGLGVVGVVAAAVLPVDAEAVRDADFVVGRDGDVARVEERVKLLGEEHAVLEVIARGAEVRLDVRGVEDGRGVLAGDRAAAAVRAEQPEAEGALAFTLDGFAKRDGAGVDIERAELCGEVGPAPGVVAAVDARWREPLPGGGRREMADAETFDLAEIQRRIRAFVAERDWAQFHTPKNLATALVCEAAELAEIFQWLTPEASARVMEDETTAAAVRDELADVLVYVLRMSDVLGVDLQRAVKAKIQKNARKYPVKAAKGSAAKYTRLRKG